MSTQNQAMSQEETAQPEKEQDTQDIFREELTRETLLGERARAGILAGLYALLLILAVVYNRLLGGQMPDIDQRPIPLNLIMILLGAAAGYEIVVWLIFSLIFRRGRRIRTRFSYLNTVLEITIPTVTALLLLIVFEIPDVPLFAAGLLYLLFIAMAVLRLDIWLSLFTGLVAAIEYLILAILSRQLTVTQYGVAAFMLLAGLLSGFVSAQIERRVIRALAALGRRLDVVGSFGQQISPELSRRLLQQKPVNVPRKKRQVAVIMLNLPEFATFAAVRGQDEVAAYMDKLMMPMLEVIRKNYGVVFKFVGGGFVASFDPAFGEGDVRKNAVDAAHNILSRLNARIASGDMQQTDLHIGIHAGEATTGTSGPSTNAVYDIDGPLIRQAVAITQFNKKVGSQLLISDTVWQATNEFYAGVQISPLNDEISGEKIGLHRLL